MFGENTSRYNLGEAKRGQVFTLGQSAEKRRGLYKFMSLKIIIAHNTPTSSIWGSEVSLGPGHGSAQGSKVSMAEAWEALLSSKRLTGGFSIG